MNTKNIFYSFLMLIGLIVFGLSMQSSEVVKARPNGYEATQETLVESQADTFTIDQQIKNQTGYFYHAHIAQDSFATDATIYLQASGFDAEAYWVDLDTITAAAAGDYYLTGTTNARRLRAVTVTDTTNSQITLDQAFTLVETF